MKILKPGPRPFVVLGTICGLLFLMPIYIGFGMGKWIDAGKMAGCLLFLPVIMFYPIAFARLIVTNDEIISKNYGIVLKRIRFDQIERKVVSVLAEKDHPVSLTLFTKGNKESVSVGLKIYRKEDVAWLFGIIDQKTRNENGA